MQKIEIKFPNNLVEELTFNGQIILVDKYISLETKYILISNYLNTIIDSDWNSLLDAKYGLILGVVDRNTNIEIISEGSEGISIDSLIGSGLWDKIRELIFNYKEFENELNYTVDIIFRNKQLQSNVNVLSEKIIELVDKISNFDLNSENLKKLFKEISEEREKLGEIYPVVKEKPVRKKRITKEQ